MPTPEELAQRDADWWVHELYAFARELGATTVRSTISRSVIDLNRDPSAIVAAAARAERECGFDDLVPNLPESQPRPARRAPQNVDPCYAVPGGMPPSGSPSAWS